LAPLAVEQLATSSTLPVCLPVMASGPTGWRRNCWHALLSQAHWRMSAPSAVPQPFTSSTRPELRFCHRNQPSPLGIACHCWQALSSQAHCRTSAPSPVPQSATSSTLLLVRLTRR
jgi:hypothetical protein